MIVFRKKKSRCRYKTLRGTFFLFYRRSLLIRSIQSYFLFFIKTCPFYPFCMSLLYQLHHSWSEGGMESL